jgi:hypothetical protein
VSDWQGIWLGVIAIAVALMALLQIVVLTALALLVRQAIAGVRDLRREVRPLVDTVQRIADDAEKISGLAVAQAERIDGLLSDTAARIDEAVGVIRRVVLGPVRQGSAVLAALRAVIGAFRGGGERGRYSRREDEDALFVG